MRNVSKTIAVLLLLAWFAADGVQCARAQTRVENNTDSATNGTTPKPASYSLLISSGDLLDLQVFDTPDLSGKLRVTERGEIALPLGGMIEVGGLTAEQASTAVEDHLRSAKVLKKPHVSIRVLEYATQGVTVVGEVKNPGVYPLLGTHTSLDLIAAAGGFTQDAGSVVTVNHREDPEHPTIVNLDNRDSASAGGAFHDVRPGDTIVVSHAGIIYVIGAVVKPGGFMIQHNGQLTVLRALALAQGANRTAALDHSKLIRTTEHGPQEISIPLKRILANKAADQALANNDILFVPSSATKSALQNLETVLPSVAGASVYRVP